MANPVFGRLRILLAAILMILASCAAPSPGGTPVPSLEEPGRYAVGYVHLTVTDPSRADRTVELTVWYPAVADGAAAGSRMHRVAPDPAEAPYPLLVSSTKVARILAPHLVGRGFVWASVDRIDYWYEYGTEILEQPRDLLLALETAASDPPTELATMIDADNTGVLGYSFDGMNAWTLSGARIDPGFYREQCAHPEQADDAVRFGVTEWGYCALHPAERWAAFEKAAGPEVVGDDELWQPVTDPRIKAVMPMAGDGWLLFGERGMAAVQRPILAVVADEDGVLGEMSLLFQHVSSPQRIFVRFPGRDHGMIQQPDAVQQLGLLAAAFFGVHLQGRTDYGRYLTREYVEESAGLAWGVPD